MSGFSADLLTKKLHELNNSQQSIQTLSLWIIHYRKHHKAVVATWLKSLQAADASRNPAKKLTLMYLANDVIQNSRKKAPEYVKEFATVLKPACEAIARGCDDKTWSSLNRILNIWSERNIYDASQLQQFKSAIGQRSISSDLASSSKDQKHSKRPSTQSTSAHLIKKSKSSSIISSSSNTTTTTTTPTPASVAQSSAGSNVSIESLLPTLPKPKEGVIIDAKQLIRALEELENAPSQDKLIREKIASFPPEVTDVSLINNIDNKEQAERFQKIVEEACILLSDYNTKLLQEMESRKSVNIMLATCISNQKDSLIASEKKLQEYKDKLKKVTKVKSELKCHLANLPDLRALPSVMAPLPSAGDLFTVSSCDQNEMKLQAYKYESDDDDPRNGHRTGLPDGSVSSIASTSPSTSSPADYSDSFSTPNS